MSIKKSPEREGSQEQSNAQRDASPFRDTLNLPRTDFPLRADAKINDPLMLKRWHDEALYAKAFACHEGAEKFILHDGPPYANGNIHLGHAYNKILKDIVSKGRRMMGYHTPVVPGWDCHGLPIEHKVTQENPGLSGVELKKECRAYAARWVNVQREEFIKLGVVMAWDQPYITMDPGYEAATLTAFADFIDQGFIERKNKTIPWCFSCKTALASAEIEYANRKDPSLYVLFELDPAVKDKMFPEISEPVSFLVWTTTPWTLALNRAVLLRPGSEYQVVKLKDKYIIVGATCADAIATMVQATQELVRTVPAEAFVGVSVKHPFMKNLQVPIILDLSVGLGEGTAAVHCAPGCGPADYETGVKNNLEIYSPLTAQGTYADDIQPQELAGMSITDGQIWAIKALAAAGTLFHKASINHSFPHCWRCHNGLMFRATPQWFCNLKHAGLQGRAVEAIESIAFSPEQGKNFLRATVENRWEWCLSRQRSWGVPIPALIKKDGTGMYTSGEFIKAVAAHVAREGIEYWDRISLKDLVDEGMLPVDFPVDQYRKETDILDVWFDSGVSHWAVLSKRKELRFPADLYLEGIDQHRGWFQSSLLTSMMLHNKPPMRTIMTHGFTVDAKGHKMSKSLGNVIAPQQIIDKLGTDGLRLWVASIGNDGDAVVSDTLLTNVEQVLRKVRNTCRFLLQNLYDYDHAQNAIEIKKLKPLDRYALRQMYLLQEKVVAAYKQGDFTAIFHMLGDYCAVEISAFYGDIAKDCLYCDGADSYKRRSTQTVFYYILDALTRLIAPIMSFTAEQVSDFYQKNKTASIHLQTFANLEAIEKEFEHVGLQDFDKQYAQLKEMRSAVLKLIEAQREQGVVKHSLEVGLELYYDQWNSVAVMGENPAEFLKEFCIVSHVELKDSPEGLASTAVKGFHATAQHAPGSKCPRCWQWDTVIDSDGLCRRCCAILK
jgi:isoleucyl-tRNA synthetase